MPNSQWLLDYLAILQECVCKMCPFNQTLLTFIFTGLCKRFFCILQSPESVFRFEKCILGALDVFWLVQFVSPEFQLAFQLLFPAKYA